MLDRGFARRLAVILGLLLLACAHGVPAQGAPKIVSIFPLGGQRGTTVEVELQGTGLEGSYAVWLGPGSRLESAKSDVVAQYTIGPDGVEAHVKAIKGSSRATVRLVLAADARIGFHRLSLVSPAGLSESMPFWVGPDAVVVEASASHNTLETAQPVKLPVAVNGRISEGRQLAHYAFEIAREQTLAGVRLGRHRGQDPPAGVDGRAQTGEELAAKDPAENAHRQEEAGPTRPPAR